MESRNGKMYVYIYSRERIIIIIIVAAQQSSIISAAQPLSASLSATTIPSSVLYVYRKNSII